jgi:response regulator NasT
MILLKSNILVLTGHKVSFQLLKPRLVDYQLVNLSDNIVEVRKYITQRKPISIVVFDDIVNQQYVPLFANLLRQNIPIIYVFRKHTPIIQQFIGEPFFKTISNQQVFSSISDTLQLLITFSSHVTKLENENSKLKKKTEMIKVVNDAKIFLIEQRGMSEEESYRHIQKIAMDQRLSKVQAAKKILEDV